ncbi:hypothetical protein CQ018_13350 [Arthrobacter sp. MYb227]|uniref:TetR/AcrR family transcriptional regulator n=1 Tax=Arthrobacter sp. MYb227 TaxID=1848601 RepID=UPI000CFB6D3E|nr:TetR/AcrR family transcriptional regulator [Arthrobacter sp. MYb227]PQZ91619.1 hypothetical protein CQ018_13350 [Arthrobacter sp. MYb227]
MGIRERHRTQMLNEIQAATLDLIEAKGLAATTVGQIAERVGISERTFFRYYQSKEHALMPGQAGLADSLRRYEPAADNAAEILLELIGACRENFAFEIEHRDFRRISRLLIKEPGLRSFVAGQEQELVQLLSAELVKSGLVQAVQAVLIAELTATIWRVSWQAFGQAELDSVVSSPLEHFDRAASALRGLFVQP